MARPNPKISQGQAKSIASLSASQVRKDRELNALREHFEQTIADGERKHAEIDKWLNGRHGMWLARLVVPPLFILTLGFALIVLAGLWSGEIKEASKFGHQYVNRNVDAVHYWLSVIYHGGLAGLFFWVTRLCTKQAKLWGRGAT
jgi:hypothetical protein